ncbi:DUF3987 domain-containing protein [Gemmatimonadota bacterium]
MTDTAGSRGGSSNRDRAGAISSAEVLPQTGFLRDYIKYAGNLTDAPDEYHWIVGYAVLATACQDRFRIVFGDQEIYPNIWAVKVGPPTFRKSTTDNIGQRLLRKVSGLTILPNEFSPESLVEGLCKANPPSGIFCWPEFGATLSRLNRDYMRGTKEMLADFFDVPEYYERSLRSGVSRLERPTLTILASSTEEWFLKHIAEEDLGGGFYSRFLYVKANSRKPLLHFPPAPDTSLQYKLVEHLKRVQSLGKRSITISDEARYLYRDALDDLDYSAGSADHSGIAKILLRLGTPYLLKLSLLNQVSLDPDANEISREAMEDAVDAIDWLKQSASSLFRYGLPTTPRDKLRIKVYRKITETGKIDRSSLLRSAGCSASELDQALATLFQRQDIEKREEGDGRCSKGVYVPAKS